jgi:DNA-binding MarR family transcriptional regulator
VPTRRSLLVLEPPDQIALHTWVQLARTYNLVLRSVTATLAQRDVTVPQFDILATLRFSEGVTQTELAEKLLVTKGNVCQLLDRMEKIGWVQRRPDRDDARINRLYLTSAGRKKVGTLLPRHDALVIASMKSLSADDVQSLRSLLATLEQGVSE